MVWSYAFIVIMQAQVLQNFFFLLEIDMQFYLRKVSKFIV